MTDTPRQPRSLQDIDPDIRDRYVHTLPANATNAEIADAYRLMLMEQKFRQLGYQRHDNGEWSLPDR